MRILVTGASGFIGAKLVEVLTGQGHAVRALMRPGREGPFLPANGVEPCRGDLGDQASLRAACRGIDAVVNAAGALGKWGVPAEELERVNVRGVTHLMEAGREAGVSHVVHLSAGGVSGPMPPVPADERTPCRPRTPYERSKWRGEQAALEAHRRGGVPLTILRPTFTYGPGDRHKLPLFRAVLRRRLVLIGDARSLIHPVFVDDVVSGILCALSREGRGETFLIGGPRAVTKRELLETIADALGAPKRWPQLNRHLAFALAVPAEAIGRVLRRDPPLTRGRVWMMGWSFGYRIDKAQQELGYQPKMELRSGVDRTAAWYRRRGLLA